MVVPCWINESSDIVRVPTPVHTYICVDKGKAITYDHRLRRTGHPVRSAIQKIDNDKKIDNNKKTDSDKRFDSDKRIDNDSLQEN
jgi:hypothetical protein